MNAQHFEVGRNYCQLYPLNFLIVTGISYPKKASKKDLWNAIKELRKPSEHIIDKMAEKRGYLCR